MLVTTAPPGARLKLPPQASMGAIHGGFFPCRTHLPKQHPSVAVGIEGIGAAMQCMQDAGGTVMGEPVLITGVGQYVVFRGTEGNHDGIIRADMPGEDCPGN